MALPKVSTATNLTSMGPMPSPLVLALSLALASIAAPASADGSLALQANSTNGTNVTSAPNASCSFCIYDNASNACGLSYTPPIPLAQQILTWVMIVLLICLSGLFSGLTLGLMGLDLNGLNIVIDGDDVRNSTLFARTVTCGSPIPHALSLQPPPTRPSSTRPPQ